VEHVYARHDAATTVVELYERSVLIQSDISLFHHQRGLAQPRV